MSGLAAIWAWARCALPRHFRRRGTFLLSYGVIFAAYGVAILTGSTTPFATLGDLGEFLDVGWWGALWVAGGAVAVLAAIRRRTPGDEIGFNGLLVPPVVWALAYYWSGLLHVATGGVVGSGRAWAAAVIWSSAVVSVLVVSGWPEAPRDGEAC